MPASPADEFARLGLSGVKRTDTGELVVPREALEAYRMRQARQHVMSRVPSVPKNMVRDTGGAVRKNHGIWQTMTLPMLRTIRDRAPLLQAIHAARLGQVRRFGKRFSGKEGAVGWKVVHRHHHDPEHQDPKGFEQFVREAEELLDSPSPRYCPHFGQALAMLEEDYLTINRPVVEILHSELDPERIAGWRPVDGALIWPTLEWLQKWKNDNPGWYGRQSADKLTTLEQLEIVSATLEYDLTGAEYCLVRDENVEAVFRPGQLLVSPFYNRTDVKKAGYPPSHVEQAVGLVLAFINAFSYNDGVFTRGMLTESFIGISGDIHPLDLQAFRDELREATQGVRRAHQPPVIPLPDGGDVKAVHLKDLPKDTLFDSFMSLTGSLTCAVYRMDVSTVGWKPWDGGSGGALSEPSRAEEIAAAKEEGLIGDLEHLSSTILTPIVRRIHPDLIVTWELGDKDAAGSAAVLEVRTRTTLTRNEARLREGLTPWPPYMTPEELEKASEEDVEKHWLNPYNHPSDPSFGSFILQLRQQKSMEEQMAQPEQGDFGPPGAAEDQYPYGQFGGDGGMPAFGGDDGEDDMNKARRRKVLRMRGHHGTT